MMHRAGPCARLLTMLAMALLPVLAGGRQVVRAANTAMATLPAPAAGGADWRTITASDFTGGQPGDWPIGNRGATGRSLSGGRYTVSVADGRRAVQVPRHALSALDGQVTATFQGTGAGEVGVAARWSLSLTNRWNLYAFWIDTRGSFGCLKWVDGTPTTLFFLRSPAIDPGADNSATLRIQGGLLTFLINDQQVSSYDDPHPLPAGTWGLWVDSEPGSGRVGGSFARVTVQGRVVPARPPGLDPGPFRVRIDSDFAHGSRAGWSTGNLGTLNAHIDDGRFTISTVDGFAAAVPPRGVPALADGQIDAVVRPEGRGRVGIMGRWTAGAGNRWSLYAFWISARGTVGCTRWSQDTLANVFSLDSALVRVDGDNLLMLRLRGGRLDFWLNGRQVFTYRDRQPLPAGTWGVYVNSSVGDGTVQGHYARILIAG